MICTGPNPSHQHRFCALNRAASRYQHLFQLTLVKRIMLWPTLPDDAASDNFKLRSLIILRTLMRSDAITASLATSKPSLALIFELFERTAREQAHLPECEQLVNLTRIVLRLAQNAQTLPVFAELSHAGHPNVEMLLFLLTTKNYHVLQSCLRALLQLAQSDDTVALLSRHLQEQSLHHILDIIKECYNPPPPPSPSPPTPLTAVGRSFPDHRFYAVKLLHTLALDLGPGMACSQARREVQPRHLASTAFETIHTPLTHNAGCAADACAAAAARR